MMNKNITMRLRREYQQLNKSLAKMHRGNLFRGTFSQDDQMTISRQQIINQSEDKSLEQFETDTSN